jgi:glycerol-3-phosphate dehydrogenase (NAD(P)+)
MLEDVCIVGSGSWATALVKIFADSGCRVSWLVRSSDQAEYVRKHGRNPRYLSHAALDITHIKPFTDPRVSLQSADLVVFSVPSGYLQKTMDIIRPDWLTGKKVAVSIKGFVPGKGMTPSAFLERCIGLDPVMVLSGPCHAEEVALQRNTYLTVCGRNEPDVHEVMEAVSAPYITCIANSDPTGVEFVSILKNVVAIAAGLAAGLNYGENFQAVVIANAMREIQQFLALVSPGRRDLFNSAYFGDLLVTAYSGYSRNKALGCLVGRGVPVHKALQAMEMVAEGYLASRELSGLLRHLTPSMTVINCVYRVLHLHASPYREFKLVEKQMR